MHNFRFQVPAFHIQILFNHCRCKYVWSVKFKNFLNFIFGRFLQFGSAVRQPAVLFSCCAFNCEEEENGHLAPISVLKYLQTGNHLYFLIHFCFFSTLLKWKVSSPFVISLFDVHIYLCLLWDSLILSMWFSESLMVRKFQEYECPVMSVA